MSDQNRQEFIRAAITFLQNPKLVDSSLQDKLKFLRDKGLSQVEVDEALNLALVHRHHAQSGKWNFLLVLGLCVGGYKLYQAYCESKDKIPSNQKSNIRQNDEKSMGRGNSDQAERESLTLQEILLKMSELKRLIELQRSNIAADIQSLKTLLLGHEKFAAPPVIPAWQLKSTEDNDESTNSKKENEGNKNDSKTKGDRKRKINQNAQTNNNGFIEATAIAPSIE